MDQTIFGIPIAVIMIICFVPAIVVHEVSHGFMAWKLGDPTAKSQGRLSLNPLKHVDPFGTVLLPIVMAAAGGPVFGYAKPVPYNPRYFKDIRKGELLTGLAGPASNLIMGILGALIVNLLVLPGFFSREVSIDIVMVGYFFTYINFILMFFNLIPIPPLDGSSVIAVFLPDKALRQYYSIQRYALPVLLIILFGIPFVLSYVGINFSPISLYLDATAGNLTGLLYGLFS
ncbi:MAG: site-2 protease family protein [Coriobacteriales bacterium]|nr:site-2 protease family protein [Coriobacteriales bacterium]